MSLLGFYRVYPIFHCYPSLPLLFKGGSLTASIPLNSRSSFSVSSGVIPSVLSEIPASSLLRELQNGLGEVIVDGHVRHRFLDRRHRRSLMFFLRFPRQVVELAELGSPLGALREPQSLILLNDDLNTVELGTVDITLFTFR